MPPQPVPGVTITYETVQKLTNLPFNTLYQAAGKSAKPGRQRLDINDLRSIVLYLAGHGQPELRRQMCGLAAQSLIDSPGKPLHGAPKRVVHRARKAT